MGSQFKLILTTPLTTKVSFFTSAQINTVQNQSFVFLFFFGGLIRTFFFTYHFSTQNMLLLPTFYFSFLQLLSLFVLPPLFPSFSSPLFFLSLLSSLPFLSLSLFLLPVPLPPLLIEFSLSSSLANCLLGGCLSSLARASSNSAGATWAFPRARGAKNGKQSGSLRSADQRTTTTGPADISCWRHRTPTASWADVIDYKRVARTQEARLTGHHGSIRLKRPGGILWSLVGDVITAQAWRNEPRDWTVERCGDGSWPQLQPVCRHSARHKQFAGSDRPWSQRWARVCAGGERKALEIV